MRSSLNISDALWELNEYYHRGEWKNDFNWFELLFDMCDKFLGIAENPNLFYISDDEIKRVRQIHAELLSSPFSRLTKAEINALRGRNGPHDDSICG
jgi:hypothetical protein